MANSLFSSFAPFLRSVSEAELHTEIASPRRLLIEAGESRGRSFEVAYAPFDYVNPTARVVIVGLTPGRQQMTNALLAARKSLLLGHDEERAAKDAKVFASFSGPMRSNLIAMLDCVGLHQTLGLATTSSLWTQKSDLAHFTSVLRYPVFMNGTNYTGAPVPLAVPLLRRQVMQWFAEEMRSLPSAVFVPLGPAASDTVAAAAELAGIDSAQILTGPPHPSGANAERIAFFLGRKAREALSSKVDAEKLIATRAILTGKVASLASKAY